MATYAYVGQLIIGGEHLNVMGNVEDARSEEHALGNVIAGFAQEHHVSFEQVVVLALSAMRVED